MHAIGEQQSKRTQSGSSSRSGRDREQHAAEADASGEHAAAAEAGAIGEQQLEADANGEQQLKRMQAGQGAAAAADSKRTQAGRAAAEADAISIGGQADAIGEQQLSTESESCPAPDYSR